MSVLTNRLAWAGSGVHDGQGPAPAGELAGDGDVGDHRVLLALGEVQPPLVQPLVAGMAAGPGGRWCQLPPGLHPRAGGAVGLEVLPAGLDQQPAGVGVAGLSDGPLGT